MEKEIIFWGVETLNTLGRSDVYLHFLIDY